MKSATLHPPRRHRLIQLSVAGIRVQRSEFLTQTTPISSPPQTRETLLIRLRDPGDEASWNLFAEIYTPLFYGFCVKRGLQHADAADVIQEVMCSVARAIRGFDYDPQRGQFKSWLFTAVRHAISGYFRKSARLPLTALETQFFERVSQIPDEQEQLDWERDYQRQLLAWAMGKVRGDYAGHIWKAFEETALRGRSPSEVAAELGMTNNAVAVARHRIIQKLKDTAHSVDAERWEDDYISTPAHARQ